MHCFCRFLLRIAPKYLASLDNWRNQLGEAYVVSEAVLTSERPRVEMAKYRGSMASWRSEVGDCKVLRTAWLCATASCCSSPLKTTAMAMRPLFASVFSFNFASVSSWTSWGSCKHRAWSVRGVAKVALLGTKRGSCKRETPTVVTTLFLVPLSHYYLSGRTTTKV